MEVLLCFGLPAENEHVDFSCPQKFIAYPQPHEILKCLSDNRPFNFRIFALINDPSPPLAIAIQPLREFESPSASHLGAPSIMSALLLFCMVFHCFHMHIRIRTLNHLSIVLNTVFISHIRK